MFNNHGIELKGFGGDTMHMARLLDSSKTFGKYSLSELTKEYEQEITKFCIKNIEKKL
jgi:DNA polymerase I